MSKRIGLVSVAMVVFVVVLVAFAGTALAYDYTNHAPDKGKIIGDPRHGAALEGANPCESCHIPHGAAEAFLFESANKTGGGLTTSNDDPFVTSDIKPLCYSCHDGQNNSVGASTAFNTAHSNHRTRAASAARPIYQTTTSLDGNGQPVTTVITGGGTTSTAYVTGYVYDQNHVRVTVAPGTPGYPTTTSLYGVGRDCDRCHDPHDNPPEGDYLKYEYKQSSGSPTTTLWVPFAGAKGNVCGVCHSGNIDPVNGGNASNKHNHPINVTPSGTAPNGASWPADANWTPWNSADYSGTRMFDKTSGLVVVPGGATYGTAQLKCESCHSPHGATPNEFTYDGDFQHLNTMAVNALCLNCHGLKTTTTTAAPIG